jgi:hypothetical protein
MSDQFQVEGEWKAPRFGGEKKPFFIRLIINLSGGLIKNDAQASIVLIVISIVFFVASIIIFRS